MHFISRSVAPFLITVCAEILHFISNLKSSRFIFQPCNVITPFSTLLKNHLPANSCTQPHELSWGLPLEFLLDLAWPGCCSVLQKYTPFGCALGLLVTTAWLLEELHWRKQMSFQITQKPLRIYVLASVEFGMQDTVRNKRWEQSKICGSGSRARQNSHRPKCWLLFTWSADARNIKLSC